MIPTGVQARNLFSYWQLLLFCQHINCAGRYQPGQICLVRANTFGYVAGRLIAIMTAGLRRTNWSALLLKEVTSNFKRKKHFILHSSCTHIRCTVPSIS